MRSKRSIATVVEGMAGYAQALALLQMKYEQSILQAFVDGPVEAIQLPTANSPLALSLGYEKRDEQGITTPDECLKLAPARCQGGAGGNLAVYRRWFRRQRTLL